MKKKIANISAFTFFLFNLSCSPKRELRLLGYACKGDRIIILKEKDTLFNFKIESPPNARGICFFSKAVKIKIEKDQIKLSAVIDSAGFNLLDTSVIFSNKVIKPFITVVNPHENRSNRRELFTGDKRNDY